VVILKIIPLSSSLASDIQKSPYMKSKSCWLVIGSLQFFYLLVCCLKSQEEKTPTAWKHTRNKCIYSLSKIVLSQEGDTWLVRIKDQPRIVEVLLAKQVGCGSLDAEPIIDDSLEELIAQI
jgi:hypothetical protein